MLAVQQYLRDGRALEMIRLARVAFVLGYEVDDFCTRADFGCVLWEPKQAPEAIQ